MRTVTRPQQPNLWANLTRLMEQKSLTHNDLADFMGWASAEQYWRWERGDRRISTHTTRRLAEWLGVPAEELDANREAFDVDTRGPSPRQPKSLDRGDSTGVQASSHTIPTTPEGPMPEQLEKLRSALDLVPEPVRARFLEEVRDLAARLRLGLEEGHVGNRRRSRRTG